MEWETYIIQYRPSLDAATPWQTLEAAFLAAFGADFTTFVHEGVVTPLPPGGGGGGGWTGGPPSPMSATAGLSDTAEDAARTSQGKLNLGRVPDFVPLPPVLWNRDTWPEEIPMPPVPWDPTNWPINNPDQFQTLSGSPPAPPQTGFYRVVRHGLHIVGVGEMSLLSGVLEIPVEAQHDNGVLELVTVTTYGFPIDGASMLVAPFSGPLRVVVDTRSLRNGLHGLQAQATSRIEPAHELASPFENVLSDWVFVNVFNEIAYPDWHHGFSENGVTFRITAAGECDWEIDIYGEAADYIMTFTGYSPDGEITLEWDLYDSNLVKREDAAFHSITKTSPPGGLNTPSVTQANPPVVRQEDDYPEVGKWAVARRKVYPSWQHHDLFLDAMNAIAALGEEEGGVLPTPPDRPAGTAFVLNDGSAWPKLFAALIDKSVRNFYYQGHGSPNAIGDNATGFLFSELTGVALGNWPPTANPHRYRFVWLDGCSTAQGRWVHAFGLHHLAPHDDPEKWRMRPGLFVGWTRDLQVGTYNQFNPMQGQWHLPYIFYRTEFAFNWRFQGHGVKQALDAARAQSHFLPHDASLYLRGYWNLRWRHYNRKQDWPPNP